MQFRLGRDIVRHNSVDLTDQDLLRHMYVVGKTGMGKSTLLEQIAIQRIRAGEGITFIDPHGESAESIVDAIPRHRTKDLVYFDLTRADAAIGINVLECPDPVRRPIVVSENIRMFRHVWSDSWGPRMQRILQFTLHALLEHGEPTLLGVGRMLGDDVGYRDKVIASIKDEVLRSFWTKQFPSWSERFQAEAIEPVLNKLEQITIDPRMRRVIGQRKSTYDISQGIDRQQIMIINLSKGDTGGEQASLLGAIWLTKHLIAAMQRPKANRKIVHTLIADEFQNFGTDAVQEIVAEARKYGLALIAAHQHTAQLSNELRETLLGTVGSTAAFRIGASDAERMAADLETVPKVLMDLDQYTMRVKPVNRGEAVTVRTERQFYRIGGVRRKIEQSNMQWARPAKAIDAELRAFYMPVAVKPKREGKERRRKAPVVELAKDVLARERSRVAALKRWQ